MKIQNNGMDYIVGDDGIDYSKCEYIDVEYNDDGEVVNISYNRLDDFIIGLVLSTQGKDGDCKEIEHSDLLCAKLSDL